MASLLSSLPLSLPHHCLNVIFIGEIENVFHFNRFFQPAGAASLVPSLDLSGQICSLRLRSSPCVGPTFAVLLIRLQTAPTSVCFVLFFPPGAEKEKPSSEGTRRHEEGEGLSTIQTPSSVSHVASLTWNCFLRHSDLIFFLLCVCLLLFPPRQRPGGH